MLFVGLFDQPLRRSLTPSVPFSRRGVGLRAPGGHPASK
jgi:hypothetical protein